MGSLLSIIIILLLAIAPVFAQQSQDAFFIIEDFSKMMQSHVTPYTNPDGVADDVLNVRANVQANALAKREPSITYGSCYAAPVKSLFRYYKSDSTKYTVENIDQYIYAGSDTGAACTLLGQGHTVGKRWDWLTYKDVAIGSNGFSAPVKWDGKTQVTANTTASRTSGDVVTELGAPFAELLTGSNLDASSWYQYKVAFLNSSGQYYFSTARSNPIQTGSSVRDIKLTDIPLGQTGTTHRYIYRTVGNASRAAVLADTTYYLVTDIANNSTRTYNDANSDATILADVAPKYSTISGVGVNVTPPYGRFLQLVKERLAMANRPDGTSNGKSIVYTSEIYNPDLFDTNDTDKTFIVRPDDGDEITMLELYLGELLVGKNGSISKILTNDTAVSGWTLSDPRSFIGIDAPYSVISMPLGIIYLNRFGLYKFNGNNSELISDAVTKDIRDISPTALGEVAGVYYNNEYNMAYASTSTGSAVNNRVLVYDFARKSFTKDSKSVDSWEVFDSGTDFGTLYAGSSTSSGTVTAQSSSPDILSKRYKSELDAGTFSDTGTYGDEDFPYLELQWNKTIDDASFAAKTINGYTPATATIDRGATTGTWISPIYDLNASEYDKLYWNAQLGTYGSVTFAIRSAASEGAVAGASWSSEYSLPSGSDLSALTANRYVQLRATLTTTDINYSPYLESVDDYVFKLVYSKVGAIAESSVLGMWKSGFMAIGEAQYPKIIYECDVYYTGTAGTLNFKFENLKGDIIAQFNIDLAQTRNPATGYFGNGNDKVFRYNFPVVPGNANFLVGDKFRITITEDSTNTWKVQRVALRYQQQPYVPYR